ncbi:hypothetical protein MKW92_003551 [Papaver armeniacum]|nr:hypothetical protein MKW92_003551 [Papaver armeniacum]
MKILMFMVSCQSARVGETCFYIDQDINNYSTFIIQLAITHLYILHLQIITKDRGLKLDKVHIGMLDLCKKVTVSLDDTIILHGGGDKKFIEERCEQISDIFLFCSNTDSSINGSMFDKEKAQERLSKLSGGVSVFKVGGASEAQVGERKDRVTYALNATKVAVEEGILLGGSVALLYSSRVLNYLQNANNDQKRGVEIIQNALKAPTFIISRKCFGVNGDFVVGNSLDQDNVNLGYDASKGMFQISTHEGTQNSLCHLSLAYV